MDAEGSVGLQKATTTIVIASAVSDPSKQFICMMQIYVMLYQFF